MLCVISHLGKPKAFPQAAYMNADSKHKQESRSERRLGAWPRDSGLPRGASEDVLKKQQENCSLSQYSRWKMNKIKNKKSG